MHILGKVLTWFAVLLAIPAIALSARFLEIQNSWTKEVGDLAKRNQATAEGLVEQREKQEDLSQLLAEATLGWNGYWSYKSIRNPNTGEEQRQPIGVQVNRQTGEIGANIGTADGLVPRTITSNGQQVQVLPVLYVFRPAGAGGQFQYVGSFQVTGLRENLVTMVPMWRVQPGETDAWNPGPGWHFRAEIPVSAKSSIDSLHARMQSTLRTLQAHQANLQIQTELKSDSELKLTQRREELLGPANPPTDPELSLEYRAGLVPAIEVEEEQRNAAVAELDRLRRLVKQATDRLQVLTEQNTQLTRSLPQPETTEAAEVTQRSGDR